MKSTYNYARYVAFAAILVLAVSATALANGTTVAPSPPPMAPPCPAQPAMPAAGPQVPMAMASNVGNSAYMYTGNFKTTCPAETTGSINMVVYDMQGMPTAGPDKGTMTSSFMYRGAQYKVDFTSINTNASFGGVGLMKPIFGNTGVFSDFGFPKITAYAIAFGNADIMKDGTMIAEDQPAVAVVTPKLHDANQQWMSTPDTEQLEVHLIVPGSMMAGGSAVPGFPNGGFFIYWPQAALDLRNVGGIVEMAPGVTVPGTVGRGPGLNPSEPLGTISMSLTNEGIKKAVGTAPFGLYDIAITNNSSRARGLVMKGMGLADTPFVRYTNILAPGQSTTFRFYFAPGKVTIRDYLSARRTPTGLANVKMGTFSSSIVFE